MARQCTSINLNVYFTVQIVFIIFLRLISSIHQSVVKIIYPFRKINAMYTNKNKMKEVFVVKIKTHHLHIHSRIIIMIMDLLFINNLVLIKNLHKSLLVPLIFNKKLIIVGLLCFYRGGFNLIMIQGWVVIELRN